MRDQATELRSLVFRCRQDAAPPLVVLAGGKPGVGVTTLAHQLADAALKAGLRCVLFDSHAEFPARAQNLQADLLLVDAGRASGEAMTEYSRAADRLILVTTPDSDAVTATYVLIKTSLAAPPPPALELIVNQADDTVAADVHRRLDRSCQRFLNLSIQLLGAQNRLWLRETAPLSQSESRPWAHRLVALLVEKPPAAMRKAA